MEKKSMTTARRVRGSLGVLPLECVNVRRGLWRVRWDICETADGMAEYVEAESDHRPTLAEVREVVTAWYNARTDERILSGFEYDGVPVWLSTENQFNYKAAYDAAVMSGGRTLPVRFKLGTDGIPVYRDFGTVEELADFYYKSLAYIQGVLEEGWAAKDAVDWGQYE